MKRRMESSGDGMNGGTNTGSTRIYFSIGRFRLRLPRGRGIPEQPPAAPVRECWAWRGKSKHRAMEDRLPACHGKRASSLFGASGKRRK